MSAATKLTVAQYRPPLRKRRFRHDELTAVDLFSGFGGLTQGIERAGFTAISAANHNEYKVDVHERNHPHVEHWIANLVDPNARGYRSVRELPAADLLAAGVSCVNHTIANSKRAYQQGLSLFDVEDPEFEERVTKSERDRATANCVLAYAAINHPRVILVECTTELQSWGRALPGKTKVGDGSTYRWWKREFQKLGYHNKTLFLNSMFFGVPQSRDRLYEVFWYKDVPTPDLEHRPLSWCSFCDAMVEAVWSWKTGVPPTGQVRYGVQYNYRCPSCRGEVIPPFAPSLTALDLSDLGTKIGDRDKPLAEATMVRAERCRQRFAEFPAVLMPAKSQRGVERHPWQPLVTQTSQQETALLSTGALIAAAGNTFEHPGSTCRTRDFGQPLPSQTSTNGMGLLTPPVAMAIDNFQGAPRGVDEPLPTQTGSETMALVSARVLPNRTHGTSRSLGEPMETLVGGAGSGGLSVLSTGPQLVTAAGITRHNGSTGNETRPRSVGDPFGTFVGSATAQGLFSGWDTINGTGDGAEPGSAAAEWWQSLVDIPLQDCYFRMMLAHEVGRGCGFDVTHGTHQGSFIVWGSARKQVDGFGNAVSPPVGEWIGNRLRAALHRDFNLSQQRRNEATS